MKKAVELTPEQIAWLEAKVAAGQFPTVDDAISTAITDLMAIANDDLAWAAPYVEEARAAVARGDVMSGEGILAKLKIRIALLKAA